MKYFIAYSSGTGDVCDNDSVPALIAMIDPRAMRCFDKVWLVTSDSSTRELTILISGLFMCKDDKLMVVPYSDEALLFGFEAAEAMHLLNRTDS